MAELDLDAIRAEHEPVYAIGGQRTVCVTDRQPWPCDAARLLAEVTRLRDELDAEREGHREQRAAALDRVRALHVPYYTDRNGKPHDHYVSVHTDDLPEGHVCQLDRAPNDPWPDICDPAVDEHMVLACYECRCPTDEGETAYLIWPCPTRKLCDEAATHVRRCEECANG